MVDYKHYFYVNYCFQYLMSIKTFPSFSRILPDRAVYFKGNIRKPPTIFVILKSNYAWRKDKETN